MGLAEATVKRQAQILPLRKFCEADFRENGVGRRPGRFPSLVRPPGGTA
jgi:hypothetical protein